MLKRILTALIFILPFLVTEGAVYFVAPSGNDADPGTINHPFATIQKAQDAVMAGDTVYVRGGVYHMRENDISKKEKIWAYVTDLDKSGTKEKPIRYWAYPGEKPVFDYKNIRPEGLRVIAFYVTGSWLFIKGLEITGVQVTIKTHTQSECFENKGSHNMYEQLQMHDGMAIGFYLLSGSYNQVLNCDAYRNYDYFSETGRGGNTDGFGCHPAKGGVENIFKGCRAWFNSDDGFDVINSAEAVRFENCMAFYNGYSPDFKSLGDGNGFKMGGYGGRKPEELPDPIPHNIIINCIAVRNKANGFYSNHHINGSFWELNVAYRNEINFNMLNRLKDNVTDVPGYDHTLVGNISYKGGREIQNIDTSVCRLANNFFDFDHVLTDKDFVSVDEDLLVAPRNPDGSMPNNGFLKPNSDRLKKYFRVMTDHTFDNVRHKSLEETLRYEVKKILFQDDFSMLDRSNWIIEQEPGAGGVYTSNNQLILDTRKGVTLWLNKYLGRNIMIEFDRAVLVDTGKNDRLSDMNVFWMATDPLDKNLFTRHGVFESYDSLNLYYVGIGGNTNSTTRFRRYHASGVKQIIGEFKDPSHLLTKNTTYHVTIIVKDHNTSLWMGNECWFDLGFMEPLTEGYFGFRSTWSRQSIKNFRIYQLL